MFAHCAGDLGNAFHFPFLQGDRTPSSPVAETIHKWIGKQTKQLWNEGAPVGSVEAVDGRKPGRVVFGLRPGSDVVRHEGCRKFGAY